MVDLEGIIAPLGYIVVLSGLTSPWRRCSKPGQIRWRLVTPYNAHNACTRSIATFSHTTSFTDVSAKEIKEADRWNSLD